MLSKLILLSALFALSLTPLLFALWGKNRKRRAKPALFINIASVFALCLFTVLYAGGEALAADEATAANTALAAASQPAGLAFIGAGVATGLACIGSGIAVAGAASAALGAISENEGLFGKALIFVVLAEGIAIYGLLVSLLMLNRV